MNKKSLVAIFVALAMVVVAIPAFADANDTDAANKMEFPAAQSAPYGEFRISVMYTGSGGWIGYDATGYNAAIAIDSLNLPYINLDMNYTVYNSQYYYYDINSNYGKPQLPVVVNGTSHDYLTVFYYDEDESRWRTGQTQSLGFYKPFADYDLNTANIALVFSTTNMMSKPIPPVVTKSVVPMSDIIDNPDFEVAFTLTADITLAADSETGYPGMAYPGSHGKDRIIRSLDASPIVMYGYGSDAYLALVDACDFYNISISGKGNVIDTTMPNSINTGYGSVQDLHDLLYGGPETGYDHYYYWTLYYDANYTEYAGWLLGFMSPLAEASALGTDPIVTSPPWSYQTPSGTFVMSEFWFKYSWS